MVAYLPLGGRGAGCWVRALFINVWGVHWVYNTPLLTCSNYFQQVVSSAGTVGEVVRCIIYKFVYNPYFKKLCPQHQVIVKARFVVFVLHHYINNKVVYFFCHQNTRFCTHLSKLQISNSVDHLSCNPLSSCWVMCGQGVQQKKKEQIKNLIFWGFVGTRKI